MFEIHGKYASALVTIDDLESECIDQIKEFLDHPLYAGCIIVIMADAHGGKGSVIGFTCTLNNNGICVNVVGVDIACGMNCWKIDTPKNLSEFDKMVRLAVPLGTSQHKTAVATMKDTYPWEKANKNVWRFVFQYNKRFGTEYYAPDINYEWYCNLASKLVSKGQNLDEFLARVDRSIGTLGGGNHFIEVDKDKSNQHYLVIHSGSRNLGKRIADYYQKLAESQEHNKGYNKDLAYLVGQEAIDYYVAMVFTKHFASMNRNTMGYNISRSSNCNLTDMFESVHNFIDDKDFTIRKGSIRSYEGELAIIPLNMRDGSLIIEGKSNKARNCSAPHGAGRVMSRGEAKRTLDYDEFVKQMTDANVFSTSVCHETLDEAPNTYKKASVIMDAISDTATIIHRLKPVYNLKCSDESGFRKKKKVMV